MESRPANQEGEWADEGRPAVVVISTLEPGNDWTRPANKERDKSRPANQEAVQVEEVRPGAEE